MQQITSYHKLRRPTGNVNEMRWSFCSNAAHIRALHKLCPSMSSPAKSTPVNLSLSVQSCKVHSCEFVSQCPVLQCPLLWICLSVSSPAMSTPVNSSLSVQSHNVQSCNFSNPLKCESDASTTVSPGHTRDRDWPDNGRVMSSTSPASSLHSATLCSSDIRTCVSDIRRSLLVTLLT